MQNSFVETLIGAAVLIIAGGFFFYAYNRTDAGAVSGYELLAKFDRIDGISVGSDVRMSGIKIGTVSGQELDPKTYRALVRMAIKSDIKIPDDSSVRVSTEGLLGGSFLAVSPGGSEEYLSAGGEFSTTQGSIDLVGLLGKAMFGSEDEKPAGQNGATPPASAAEPAPAPATP